MFLKPSNDGMSTKFWDHPGLSSGEGVWLSLLLVRLARASSEREGQTQSRKDLSTPLSLHEPEEAVNGCGTGNQSYPNTG